MANYELHEFEKTKVFTKKINTKKVVPFHNTSYTTGSKGITIIDNNKDLTNSRTFINLSTTKISQEKFNNIVDIAFYEFKPIIIDTTISDLKNKVSQLNAMHNERKTEIILEQNKVKQLMALTDTLSNQIANARKDNLITDTLKVGDLFNLYSAYDSTKPNINFQNTNMLLSKDRKAVGVISNDGLFKIYTGNYNYKGEGPQTNLIKTIGDISKRDTIIAKRRTDANPLPLWYGMKINPGQLRQGITSELLYLEQNEDVAKSEFGYYGKKAPKDHWFETGSIEVASGTRKNGWKIDNDGRLEIYAVFKDKFLPDNIIAARPEAETWVKAAISRVNTNIKNTIENDFKKTTETANATRTEKIGSYQVWKWRGRTTVDQYGEVPILNATEKAALFTAYNKRKQNHIKNFHNEINQVVNYLESNYGYIFTAVNIPGNISPLTRQGTEYGNKQIKLINIYIKTQVDELYKAAATYVNKTKNIIVGERKIIKWRGVTTVYDYADVPFYTPLEINNAWLQFTKDKRTLINIFIDQQKIVDNELQSKYNIRHEFAYITDESLTEYLNDIDSRPNSPEITLITLRNEEVSETNGVLQGQWNPQTPLIEKNDNILTDRETIWSSDLTKLGYKAFANLDDNGILALISTQNEEVWSTRT
jgi:hypothetical protein